MLKILKVKVLKVLKMLKILKVPKVFNLKMLNMIICKMLKVPLGTQRPDKNAQGAKNVKPGLCHSRWSRCSRC
ncbi:hypothetical protein CBR_g4603 [Chara braunii]|uniref:Uncharacterized protein n=1 Tax=Chara braunii TaxID=69332 RepID=A0A388KI94_CHABU|nr:hypothetical protein CBR_g4603 [Chara braunii]|eukprot:GBG69772.1 hypothetical protein CBR_g4603 [Chara braunii]